MHMWIMIRLAGCVAVASAVIVAVVTCACGSKTEERTIGDIRLQEVLDRLKGGADREELRMWLGRCVGERVELPGRFNGVESEQIPGEPERRWACVTLAEAMEADDMMARTVLAAVPGGDTSGLRLGTPVRVTGTVVRVDTGLGSMKTSFACYFVLDAGSTIERR